MRRKLVTVAFDTDFLNILNNITSVWNLPFYYQDIVQRIYNIGNFLQIKLLYKISHALRDPIM